MEPQVSRRYGLYLFRRCAIWYVRIAVPQHLQPFVGCTEVKRSLHTSDRLVGSLLALQTAQRIRQEWAQVTKKADEWHNLVVNIANGTIELTHPISKDDITHAAELAQKMG